MKKIIPIFILSLIVCTSLGCETVKGVGKDIQNAGEGMQKVFK